jgi:hypothetical protein
MRRCEARKSKTKDEGCVHRAMKKKQHHANAVDGGFLVGRAGVRIRLAAMRCDDENEYVCEDNMVD